MLALILQGILLYGLFLAGWRVLHQYLVKTSLDKLPGPPSPSLFLGNFRQIFSARGWDFHKDIAANHGGVVKLKGLFGENQLYVFDPKALYHIVVQDQHIYEEAPALIQGNLLVFGKALFSTQGDDHRRQKRMLNRVFSATHIREMVPVFNGVTQRLRNSILKKVRNGPQEIDLVPWMARTMVELMGQSGLGYSFDTLAEEVSPNPYSASMIGLGPALMKIAFLHPLLPYMANIGTAKFRRFMVGLLPWKNLRDVRDMVDTMHNISLEIFESRRRVLLDGDEAVTRQVGQGKDILSILIKANMDASEEDKLDEAELIAQVSGLTFPAVDTVKSVLLRTLHLLAQHPDIQEKLRREVTGARAKTGNLTHEELVSLPYLDAICRETLRLYPPASLALRTTREDIILPLSKPLKGLDGEEIREIAVPNNTNIVISILAANRNPDIWGPDSVEWIPERWLSPLPPSVSSAHVPGVYSHLMTYLGGGRACIGFKFSQLAMKVFLSNLISSFCFAPSKKEIFWQMTIIAAPSVVGERGKFQLPLRVSRA